MSSSISVTVIDVQVFTRDGMEKDARAISNDKEEINGIRKDLDDQMRIIEADAHNRIRDLVLNKVAEGGPNGLKSGGKVTQNYLDELENSQLFELRLKKSEINDQIEAISKQLQVQKKARMPLSHQIFLWIYVTLHPS